MSRHDVAALLPGVLGMATLLGGGNPALAGILLGIAACIAMQGRGF